VSDFAGAYDAALGAWPVPPAVRTIPTGFGTTLVHDAGPADGRPLVLLHGGGATSASWYANVGPLAAAGIRVYAVDIICDRGRSEPGRHPVRTPADLVAWLTETMHGLGLSRADLAGHSYGGWIAAYQAIHAPNTVDGLVLVDASTVFAGFNPGYLLRSLPVFIGGAKSMRRLLDWEIGGRAHGMWADLMCTPFGAKAPKLVMPKRPSEEELRRLPDRTLVLVAGHARAHDGPKVAAAARRLLPNATVEVLPEASHHTLPAEDSDGVNAAMVRFLGARTD
jgi:pimeloyl-ACP methyl ester carboxylesterase